MDAESIEFDEKTEQMLQRSKTLGMYYMPPDNLQRPPIRRRNRDDDDTSESESEETQDKENTQKNFKSKVRSQTQPKAKPAIPAVSNQSNFFIYGFCSLVVVLAAIYIFIGTNPFQPRRQLSPFEPELLDVYRTNIAPFKTQFPSERTELWSSVFAGLKETSERGRLSVVLLLHDEGTNASCLARALGRIAAVTLDRTTSPLLLSAAELDQSAEHRRALAGRRAVVVEGLQRLPRGADQMRLLHGLTDRENPIAPAAVVVLTLQLTRGGGGTATAVAERELYRVWEWIDSESRGPLVVRVTSGFVYKVAGERNAVDC